MTLWNPYTPGYFKQPYVHLAECRNNLPVQLGPHKEWMLFNYADVREILRAPQFGTVKLSEYFAEKENSILGQGQCPFLSKGTKKWLMYLDGAEHLQARNLVDSLIRKFNFTPFIQEAIEFSFSANSGKEKFDFIDIATQIPLYIVETFLGIKGLCTFDHLKKLSHLLAVSQDLFVSKTTLREINQGFAWSFEFFKERYRLADATQQNNFIEFLKQLNEEQHYQLTEDEIISIITVIFMAALETTKDSIGVIGYELLKSPELTNKIIEANEIEINIITEELLRFVSPLQYTVRVALDDFHLRDLEFKKGVKLFLCLASANRDPLVFDKPDEILTNRKYNPHVSFGSGAHTCIGAKVARNEIRTWLKPLAYYLMNYSIDNQSEVVWQKTIMMRGVRSLMVKRIN